jgi:hypothetical protein
MTEPNDLEAALANLGYSRRVALVRAAAEKRDASLSDPRMAAVWHALAVAAAEVTDAENIVLRAAEDAL